ncbi:DUF4129 domain-containing protein [Flavobacterium sp.]|uniref:DUF4129 domain-containing protein n=1 Tax=Flavobacterium sp. TaxID=239 RepID=UPI0026128E64|nr:DUF4129 domain-containing protein [Flavobacterium sp.]
MNKYFIYILLLFAATAYPSPQLQVADSVATYTAVAADSAAVASPPAFTPRSFNDDFKDTYSDGEFRYETKTRAKSAWDRFWEAVGKFLRDLFGAGEEGANSGIMSYLGYLLAGGIVLFAVYMIVKAVLNKESGWIFGRSAKNIATHDLTEEDIRQMDFPSLIEETRQSANYRLAIRYYYLWLLKKMSVKEIINWHWDKTNSEYAYEIKDSSLRKEFEYLSYLYDYSWYGEFPIDETAFIKAEKAFRKTINTI